MSDIGSMTLSSLPVPSNTAPRPSRRRPLGLYSPRAITPRARWRFRRERVAQILDELGPSLSVEQRTLVDAIVAEQWGAVVAEAERRCRDAQAHRRAERALWTDLRRSLAAAAPADLTGLIAALTGTGK
jgi:hypothetical protein